MSNQENLETVDVSEEVNHDIKLGEAYKRLQDNPDFKTLILNGYLNEKVLASVSLLSVPAIKQRGDRPNIMEDLVAASNLQYFLQIVEERYLGATDPILSDEELKEFEAQGGVQ